MPLVDRLSSAIRKHFTNATLTTADQAAAKSRVSDIAFFRKPTLTLFVASYGLLLAARDTPSNASTPSPVSR